MAQIFRARIKLPDGQVQECVGACQLFPLPDDFCDDPPRSVSALRAPMHGFLLLPCPLAGRLTAVLSSPAAKKLKHGTESNSQAYKDLVMELDILTSVQKHPNLVQFFGACIKDTNNPVSVSSFLARFAAFSSGGAMWGLCAAAKGQDAAKQDRQFHRKDRPSQTRQNRKRQESVRRRHQTMNIEVFHEGEGERVARF